VKLGANPHGKPINGAKLRRRTTVQSAGEAEKETAALVASLIRAAAVPLWLDDRNYADNRVGRLSVDCR